MSIAYSFSKNTRDGSLGGGRNDSPGPDNYDPDRAMKVVKEVSPEWSFSRTGRPNENDQNPGPGSYDYDANRLKMNVSYSMGNRSAVMTPQKQDLYQNPGPGSYEPQLLNKPPVFSMQGKRQEQRPSNVPGPGYYEVGASNSSLLSPQKQGVSPFGTKSKRDTSQIISYSERERFGSLGPGAYSPKHDAVKYKNPTFGMHNGKGISSRDINPGPGAYDALSKEIGKSLNNISMGSRPQTAKVSNTPGPGSYSNNHKSITQLSSSQRGVSSLKNKSQRMSSISKDQMLNPGPGAYEANKNAVKDKVKASTFSKGAKRDNYISKEEKSKPGPGNYNLPDSKSSKSFKIGEKINKSLKNQTPGPGNYDPNPNVIKDSTRNVKITNSQSNNKSQLYHSKSISQLPGPGQYDTGKQFGQNVPTYSMRGRPKDQRNDFSPAPGQYDPSDMLSKDRVPTASIKTGSKRLQDFNTSNSVIGPGQYNDSSKKIGSDSKAFSFRPKPKDQPVQKVPGPGAYDANHNVIKDSIRNTKMSNSQRQDIVSKQVKEMPGPGNYASINEFGQGTQSFTIQSKRDALKRDMIPGPGSYNAADTINRDKSPSYRMGTSARTQVINREQTLSPGPGNYELHDHIGSNGPQYSIKGRQEQKIQDNKPGPGGYDPNVNYIKDSVKGFQMSKSQRQQIVSREAQHMPGPGIYNSPTKIGDNGPKYTMGGRSKSRQEFSPGPGQYEPVNNLTKDNTPSYAISKSLRNEIVQKYSKEQPGPGQYSNSNEFGQDAKSFQIRGKPNDMQRSDIPGPGSYQADASFVKDRIVSHKMSKSTRADIVTKEMLYQPGPGEYDSPRRFGDDAQTVSIRGRPKDVSRDNVPGPGNYDPNSQIVKDRTVAYKMSNSKRTDIVSKEVHQMPGPGIYNSTTKIGDNGPKYTMGGRSKSRQELSPGPGQYEPANNLTKDKSVAYAMSKSVRQEIVQKHVIYQPGPGQYTNQDEFGKDVKSFQIRGKPNDTIKSDVPGPGAYQGDNNVVKDRVVSYQMSKTTRTDIVTKEMLYQPGPGEYHSPTRFGDDAQAVSIRGRPRDVSRGDSPGPGNYDPNSSIVKDRTVAYKMSNSKRTDIVSKEVQQLPGPGIYDQHSQIGKNVSYTIQGKPKDQQDTKIPGPGQYDPKDFLTKDQAQTSFKMSQSVRQDIVSKEQLQLPGPGIYNNAKNFGADAQTFSIRGKPQDKVGNDIPGPGQYDSSLIQTKDKVISYKIESKTQRTQIVSRENMQQPGPGQYESPSRLNNQTFTIGQRNDSPPKNDIPGPGQYNPDENVTRHNNPSFKIDQHSQRTQIVSREAMYSPGPGNYSETQQFGQDAKGFSIRGKPNDMSRSDIPGPGQYNPDETHVRYQSPSYKINSTTQRTQMISREQMSMPGPGNYNDQSQFGQDAQSFQIRGKPNDNMKSDIPGPGTYNQDESMIRHQSPSYKIDSRTSRTQLVSREAMNQPGPGNYSDHNQFGQDAQSFSIRGKPNDNMHSDIPGPGQYNPDESVVRHQNPSFKIDSKTSRTQMVSREAMNQPGPGNYNDHNQFGQDAQSFSIRGRPNDNNLSNVPGPGEYNLDESNIRYQNPSYKIDGNTQRTQLVHKEQINMPGPGNYSDSHQFGQDAHSVSIRGRPNDNRPSDIPGPGSYNQDESMIRHQNPSFRIDANTQRTQLVSREAINQPGPGNYNDHNQFGQDAQSFQIRGKPNDNNQSDVPGPGQYDAQHNVIKDQARSFRMPQTKRDFLTVDKDHQMLPGPGQYDQNNSINGPSYTIRGRDSGRDDNGIPGPGHYEQTQDMVRHQNPSVNFSRSPDRSQNNSPQREHLPGPGQYDGRDYNLAGNTSISYTIPKGEIKDPSNDTPGPGHYKIPVKFADTPGYSGITQNEEFRYV